MRFLLDTDVFSTLARDGSKLLQQRLAGIQVSDLALSAVTTGEIDFGLAKKLPGAAALSRIEHFRSIFVVLPVTEAVARAYGPLRAHLRQLGTPIGPNDLWIAAHALSLDLTLVTGNEREFARVPTLRVENWMR